MKQFLFSLLLLLILLNLPASAAIGSKGLILEGGKEVLILKKGEKEYLNVRDGFTKLPIFKNISYYSDNTVVATVGLHNGILRANNIGSATISAISRSGDAGQISIKVVYSKEKSFLFFLPIILIVCVGIFYYIKR